CFKDALILSERRAVEAPSIDVAEGSKAPIGDLRTVRASLRRPKHSRKILMDRVSRDIVSIMNSYALKIAHNTIPPMIESIAPDHRTRRRMFIAISKRPGILTGHDPNVPATVQSLTAALSQAGAAAIVVPGCEHCGRKMQLPHRAPHGGRHCSRCEKNYRARPCAGCGQRRPIHKNLDGQYFCRSCWKLDPRSFGICQRCHETASVRNALDGTLVCNRCYKPPKA